MSIKLTPHTIAETLKFIVACHTRKCRQLISNVKNPEHIDYKKYNVCRPRLSSIYYQADAELNGIQLLLLDHKNLVEDIKAARKELHDDWQLHDFEIVALQRPGTKPPFFVEAAA